MQTNNASSRVPHHCLTIFILALSSQMTLAGSRKHQPNSSPKKSVAAVCFAGMFLRHSTMHNTVHDVIGEKFVFDAFVSTSTSQSETNSNIKTKASAVCRNLSAMGFRKCEVDQVHYDSTTFVDSTKHLPSKLPNGLYPVSDFQ